MEGYAGRVPIAPLPLPIYISAMVSRDSLRRADSILRSATASRVKKPVL